MLLQYANGSIKAGIEPTIKNQRKKAGRKAMARQRKTGSGGSQRVHRKQAQKNHRNAQHKEKQV
jgi:hypothetical protein